jgi:HAE1 family hydrophobic/amphiphilic exporter-1
MFWKVLFGFENINSFYQLITNLLKWCLDHYKTLAVVVLFFSSIALVPLIHWWRVFAKSDSGEFFVQIDQKMRHWNKVILWSKAAFLNTQKYEKSDY